jgi:hypothetical protein
MLPHMIYGPGLRSQIESRVLWNAGTNGPPYLRTSAITQPPLIAVATERVAAALPQSAAAGFVAAMLPSLLAYHDWLYRERDPGDTGLVACVHPWESGMDDAPYWTAVMNYLPRPPLHWRWIRELRPVNPAERARASDLQHMFALVQVLKSHRYDSRSILEHSSVVVIDVAFNTMLVAANEALEHLAERYKHPLPAALHRHFGVTRHALESLWDDKADGYRSQDYHTGRPLLEVTAAEFLPLFAGTATRAHAETLRHRLTVRDYNTPFPVPSVPTASRQFDANRYWRGPTWINLNWFIIKGLRRYDFVDEAEWLRLHTLGLIAKSGFREYYNPLTGDGLGSDHFSWTAALALDLLAEPKAAPADFE